MPLTTACNRFSFHKASRDRIPRREPAAIWLSVADSRQRVPHGRAVVLLELRAQQWEVAGMQFRELQTVLSRKQPAGD